MTKQNDVGGMDAAERAELLRRLEVLTVQAMVTLVTHIDTDTLKRLHAALLASPAAVGWQPIETAPKDGDVLLYCCDTKEQLVGFSVGNGLFQFACHGGGEIVCRPDLWQPLPSPPAIASQEVGHE